MSQLPEIEPKIINAATEFKYKNDNLDFTICDFWKWNQSNLIENRTRGILAEYIVKQALDIKNPTRIEWDCYDLISQNEIKIEIKSAAYIQSWHQNKKSIIRFDIAPKKTLLKNDKYSDKKTRNSDLYIFCLLHHEDQNTINPMNLNQWTFYIISTSELNIKYPMQKTIGLSGIKKIKYIESNYENLKSNFNKITKHN